MTQMTTLEKMVYVDVMLIIPLCIAHFPCAGVAIVHGLGPCMSGYSRAAAQTIGRKSKYQGYVECWNGRLRYKFACAQMYLPCGSNLSINSIDFSYLRKSVNDKH